MLGPHSRKNEMKYEFIAAGGVKGCGEE